VFSHDLDLLLRHIMGNLSSILAFYISFCFQVIRRRKGSKSNGCMGGQTDRQTDRLGAQRKVFS